ncbi:hypothetical protein FQA39_LY10270 [Lamprigera yunnana]|nr:hypothetical protein FQA39_LY10270 [Lamprigera yunnana]
MTVQVGKMYEDDPEVGIALEEGTNSIQKKRKTEVASSCSTHKDPLTHILIDDTKSFIKEKFLVEMPADFYSFWDFCKSIKKNDPCNALANVDLCLIGPYDVLAEKFINVNKPPEDYLIHWRYYHDPPEFQAVLKQNHSGEFHIGYFRDDPSELPVFLAGNNSKENGEFACMGENIFAAVWQYLESFKKKCDPFKKLTINSVQNNLKKYTENLQLCLDVTTDRIKERNKKIVVRTFNSIGLVIPYNRKTQMGYRHLCVDNKELKKLLDRVSTASVQQKDKVMSELQPILTATSIATDECDFGTGIELGWDILAHGIGSLNSIIARYLAINYELIDRGAFAKISRAHMDNRRKGVDLSIL